MSIETISEIFIRIKAREDKTKIFPLPVDSSATRLDVEDAFLEDQAPEKKVKKTSAKPGFDSEPE